MCSGARAIRDSLCGLATTSLIATVAVAGPLSDLVIFGDSLSDVGNISQATAGIYPGQYYFDGRFSNGPVYIEALAEGLELGPPLHSRAGGNNFAHGGAQTSGTGGLIGFFIDDVDEQVDDFLDSRAVDPDALFVIFAGANDLVGGQTNVSPPVNSLATDIGRLAAAGARQFLVPNLPLLGFTPRFNGSSATAEQYNSLSTQFNDALDTALDDLQASHPELTLFRLDVAALFNQALADPASFGLTNVSDAAAPGLEPGDTSYNTDLIAGEPNEYLFWDDLHPTAAVHAILAERALALLLSLPGDYNGDGIVNAADYTAWRDHLGAPPGTLPNDVDGGVIGQAQYETWKANFGNTSGGGSLSNAAVPEPASMILAALALIGGIMFANCVGRP